MSLLKEVVFFSDHITLDRPFFSSFHSVFHFSSFSVCSAESVSPILFRQFPSDSGNFPDK